MSDEKYLDAIRDSATSRERERILALVETENERCFCEFPLQHLLERIIGTVSK